MPLPLDSLVYLATRPWQLGDVATWISAAASVATVILALVASIVGYRVYKVESGRDARAELDRRERAADDRRSQASLVSAWYGRIENQLSTRPTSYLMRLPASYTCGAWVANAAE